MSPTQTGIIRITHAFTTSAECVFDAWLDPAIAKQFLFATPTGKIVRVDIDARVGGQFVIVRRDGEDIEHVGEYLEIDRPRKLVFTFAVPKYSAVATRVAIDIVPTGTGCELTLTHEGVLPEWAERSQQGWDSILTGLDRSLSKYARVTGPGEVRIERLLPGPIERVWEYLVDSEKRGRWLATGPLEPRIGGKVDFLFLNAHLSPEQAQPPEKYKNEGNGSYMVGEVLAYEPPTHLSYTWSEVKGEYSIASFHLEPAGEMVRLTITHQRLSSRAMLVGVAGGWHTHLTILEDVLAGRTPAAFWKTFNIWDAEYEARVPADTDQTEA